MYGRDNNQWCEIYDTSHYERCHRYSYIKKMYFKLKSVYRNDLHSPIWQSIVKELQRVDANNKRQKKEAKRQRLINEILATQSVSSLFNDDYESLNRLDTKALKKRHKARCKKKKRSQKPRSVKQKMNDLRKSINLYDDGVLIKGYLQADTLRQYLELRPGKLNMKYFTNLLSKELETETYRVIIEIIEKSHKFVRMELQQVVDYCNIKLNERTNTHK